MIKENVVSAVHSIAYFMDLPPDKGGADWYVGVVLRISKCGTWADVSFSDGKLWCKVLETERGARWVAVESPRHA